MLRRAVARVMDAEDPRLESFRLLASAGRHRAEISRMLGVDRSTVDRWARLAGVRLTAVK